MSILNQLIDAGNLEIALDLITNATNLIDKELKNVAVCEGFKENLADYKFRCTQKLDSECVSIVVQWVHSKIQFHSAEGKGEDFKRRFRERFVDYFEDTAAKLVDFPAIEQQAAISMDDSDKDRSFLQRLRHFVALLLRTKEMDQFLRSLKTQFNNTAQALYDSFLDILFEKSQSSQPAAAAIAGADASAGNQIV